MADKVQPFGVCDHCLGTIPRDRWRTAKGRPRLYCCRDCRNTANSRAGAAERGRQARERIRRGEWVNPATLQQPDPANIGAGVSRARGREVAAGTWRNPGLTPAARAINSQPEKHSGDLADAIERLTAGARVADLTPEQADAHRAWRRELYRRRRESMTDEERERQRERWRDQWRRRSVLGGR